MNFGGAGPTPAAEGVRMIHRAIDAGINFIDTANRYTAGESEKVVGEALATSSRRDKVVLATKCGNPVGSGPNMSGASRYHIIAQCEESLRRLRTDHIDLYQLHRPSYSFPQDEPLRAFDDLIRTGKVRYVGCSTHPTWMVMEALAIAERHHLNSYVSEQPPYNLLDRRIENELLPLCQKYDLAILPWSPLGGGMLSGRYAQGADVPADSRAHRDDVIGNRMKERLQGPGMDVALQVARMAKERGMTTAQLALLWVKDQPGITAPIVGPRTMQHLEDALGVLERTLDDADRPKFDALVHPGSAVADFHSTSGWMKQRI
jgi:aryl-alcohol dehydrogenase-like predicted oxidoreductase